MLVPALSMPNCAWIQRSQLAPLKVNQVQNRFGGFVWQVSDLNRLQRFIFLGSDSSFCYKATGNEPKREDALCIDRYLVILLLTVDVW